MSDKEKEEEEEVIEFTKGEMEMLKVRTRISTFRKCSIRIMTSVPPLLPNENETLNAGFLQYLV